MTRKRFLICLVIAAGIAITAVQSFAGTKVVVGRRVPRNELLPMDQIDHSLFDQLLREYVDGQGNVAYAAWKASDRSRGQLTAYLNRLSAADLQAQSSKEARLAFWINAYNALTIHGILREYPTTSIRNHTARFYGYNIWQDLQLVVGGSQFGIEQIEHEVLRKMGEPRIHFAIVCASISCPRLRNEAYTAARLEEQLSTNAREFFANPANFRYDTRQQRFYLSSILKWFARDFGSDQAERLRNLSPYLPQSAVAAAQSNGVRVSYLRYDWGLNDQRR